MAKCFDQCYGSCDNGIAGSSVHVVVLRILAQSVKLFACPFQTFYVIFVLVETLTENL